MLKGQLRVFFPNLVRKRSVEEEKHYYQHQRPPYGYDERQYEYNRHPTGYYPGYYDQHNRPEYRRPPIDYQRGPPPGEYYPRPAGDYSRAEYHSYNPQIYPSVQGYHPSSGHSSQGYHPSGPSQAPSAYHPVAPNPQGPLVYHPIGPGLPPLSQSHASGPVERPPSATSAQIPPYSAVSGYSAPNGASVPPEPVVYLPSAPSAAPVSTYSSATAPSINALPHPPYREYPPSYYHPNEYNQYYLPHPQFYDDPRHSHYGYNARPYAPPGQYYRHYPDQPPSPSQSYQPQVYSGSSLPATTSAQPQMYPPSSLPDSARREYPVYQPVLMKPEEGDNSEVDNELNEDVVEGEDES